jgi:uncharacterized membrane protein YhaH (DUF805 family)
MGQIIEAISYNLTNLFRFGGADRRSVFWPYAGCVIGLAMAAMAAVMLPEMQAGMARMEEFAAGNPDKATIQRGPGHYSIKVQGHHPELMPDMGNITTGMSVVFAVTVLLLAAAVARRLHDTGRSGAWGLMPLPFIIYAMVMMPRLLGASDPDMGLFFSLVINNLLYLASLALLVVLLARPGKAGAA